MTYVPVDELCRMYLNEAKLDYIFFQFMYLDIKKSFSLGSETELRCEVLEVVKCLLHGGLRPLNFSGPGSSPKYWESDDIEEIVAEIKDKWSALNRDLDIMSICWFGYPDHKK